ncbi:hypothetical protein MRX96_003062 [Rhipicephalus microplus]
MICGELRRCESLEKLALRVPCYFTEKSLKFVAKLPHLDRLRELELSRVRFDRRSVVGLSKLLASTQSLTMLNITEQDMSGPRTRSRSSRGSNRELDYHETVDRTSLLIEAHQEANTMFADFLCKNNTLRTLGVTSLFRGASSYFRPIIEPLYQNTTLRELSLIGMNVNSPRYELITDMLRKKNRTLTSFHMVDCFCYNNGRISSPVAMCKHTAKLREPCHGSRPLRLRRLPLKMASCIHQAVRILPDWLQYQLLKRITTSRPHVLEDAPRAGAAAYIVCYKYRIIGGFTSVRQQRKEATKGLKISLQSCRSSASHSPGTLPPWSHGDYPDKSYPTLLPEESEQLSHFCHFTNPPGGTLAVFSEYSARRRVMSSQQQLINAPPHPGLFSGHGGSMAATMFNRNIFFLGAG